MDRTRARAKDSSPSATEGDRSGKTTAEPASPELMLAPSPLTVASNVLAMQRTAGNRAVARTIASRTPGEIVHFGPSNGHARPRIVRTPASAVLQRNPGDEGAGGGVALAAALKAVEEAPQVHEDDVADGDKVPEALAGAQQVGGEISGAQGNPGLGEAVEAEARETPDQAPPPASPGPVNDLASYTAALSSGAPPEAAAEQARAEPEPEPAPTPDASGAAPGAAARPTNRTKRYGNNTKATAGTGARIGGTASSLASAGMAGAQAFGAAATTTITTTATALGYVASGLSAIMGFFDLKSALSSRRAMKKLEVVMAELKAANPRDIQMITDIEYAINQKYSKATTRAVKAVTALTSAGISIGALAAGVALGAIVSNPVGWVIGAVIVGICAVVGLGIAAYKLGHKLMKWYRGDLGTKRRAIAMRLYDRLIAGDATALAAIEAMGLNGVKMRQRAAAGEAPSAAEARAKSESAKEVAANLARRTAKVQESTTLVEAARLEVMRIRTRINWVEANANKAQHFASPEIAAAEVKKLQKELTAAEKDLAAKQEKLLKRSQKKSNDEVQADWKSHSKKAREDISFIEKKLKK